MIRDALFCLGLVLYPATQLRFGGLAIGPGELCFIAWIGVTLTHRLLNERTTWNAALPHLIAFWLVLGLAQSLGMIIGLVVEPFQDIGSIVHDVFAYALLITVSFLLALEMADDTRRRRIVWFAVILGALVLVIQVADGFDLIGSEHTDAWFFNRFRGWSHDPNQLGFISAALTLLSLHLLETTSHATARIAAVVCASTAVVVGIMTKSDSYVVCLIVAGSVLVACKGWPVLTGRIGPLTSRQAFFGLVLMTLPLAALAATPFARTIVNYIEFQSAAVYDDDSQGDTRLHLWTEAYEKGLESGMLGFGPGAHLTSKSYKRPPPDKFEAHNTTLDLFTQGGIAAIIAFAWLCLSTIGRTWRAELPALTALAVGVTAFSMFHFVIRHPMFWFAIVLCLLEAARGARTVASSRSGFVRSAGALQRS